MVDNRMTANGQLLDSAAPIVPAFLERVRLRAQRRALWMRLQWSKDGNAPMQGLAISHAEIDRILADHEQMARAEEAFYQRDEAARQLTVAIEAADCAVDQDPGWNLLRSEFGLTIPEADLLSMAVALEVDVMLGRVYGYLHDDANALHPTPWLAGQLFGWPSVLAPNAESV